MSTRLNLLVASNVSRVKSPFIFGSSTVACWLTRGNDAGVHVGRRVLVEPRAQVGRALRLEEIVEDAHLRLVVGPALDLGRAGGAEARVVGRAVAQGVELRVYALACVRAGGRRLR